MAEGASTIAKALTLLDFFSESRPYLGLSELSKSSGFNKASTLRFLTALREKGFVEQDEKTRTYCIGPAFLRFAQLREATVPISEAVQVVLRDLNAATRETVHAAILTGDSLANIGTIESKHANRVSVEPGEVLPFHATSSGLAVLAFLDPKTTDSALSGKLGIHAGLTQTDPEQIRARLATIAAQGFAKSSGTYEDGVTGIAAPHFGPDGRVCGSVAVALPSVRADDKTCTRLAQEVRNAARRLTEMRGGKHPIPNQSPH